MTLGLSLHAQGSLADIMPLRGFEAFCAVWTRIGLAHAQALGWSYYLTHDDITLYRRQP